MSQDQGVTLGREPSEVPDPPEGLCMALRSAWDEYWASDIARATDITDVQVISRLFWFRQQQREIMEEFSDMAPDERLTPGSRNADSLRAHPYFDQIRKLEETIQKLEDKLGLSPLSRARLGIELGHATLTWQEIKRKQGSELTQGAETQGSLPVGSVVG